MKMIRPTIQPLLRELERQLVPMDSQDTLQKEDVENLRREAGLYILSSKNGISTIQPQLGVLGYSGEELVGEELGNYKNEISQYLPN